MYTVQMRRMRLDLQFFAKDGEGGEKTEPATQKKLTDARKEGKVAKSKELNSAFGLLVLFLCLRIFIAYVGGNLLGMFPYIYGNMSDFVKMNEFGMSSKAASSVLFHVIIRWLLTVLPFFVFGVVVTTFVCIVQVGWTVSAKPMQPKLSKFNPINGFKRIFSKETLMELLKSIVKVGIIVYIAYSSIRDEANTLFVLYELELNQAVALVGSIIFDVGLKISIFYIVFGFADWAYQKWKFKEDMKMTKQEVKDEYKNTEGDPQIKSRQRQKMREVSQRRMMQAVPQADVVITNPTHLAVALKYDRSCEAPYVVAKGADYVALKIKEVARENGVEIVENKPLARMLYHNVDIGAMIPPELYLTVADILATIFQKQNRKVV